MNDRPSQPQNVASRAAHGGAGTHVHVVPQPGGPLHISVAAHSALDWHVRAQAISVHARAALALHAHWLQPSPAGHV